MMLMGWIGIWVGGFRRLYDGEFRDWTGDFECCGFAFCIAWNLHIVHICT